MLFISIFSAVCFIGTAATNGLSPWNAYVNSLQVWPAFGQKSAKAFNAVLSDNLYFEHQDGELLPSGIHAVNNFLQRSVLSRDQVLAINEELHELSDIEGTCNLDVIQRVLREHGYETKGYVQRNEISHASSKGFFISYSDHWVVIRQIGDQYVLLDSKNEKPAVRRSFQSNLWK